MTQGAAIKLLDYCVINSIFRGYVRRPIEVLGIKQIKARRKNKEKGTGSEGQGLGKWFPQNVLTWNELRGCSFALQRSEASSRWALLCLRVEARGESMVK